MDYAHVRSNYMIHMWCAWSCAINKILGQSPLYQRCLGSARTKTFTYITFDDSSGHQGPAHMFPLMDQNNVMSPLMEDTHGAGESTHTLRHERVNRRRNIIFTIEESYRQYFLVSSESSSLIVIFHSLAGDSFCSWRSIYIVRPRACLPFIAQCLSDMVIKSPW